MDDPVDQGALPRRTQPFDDDKNGDAMFLTLSLEVGKFLPLLLNLLEHGLVGLRSVFHRLSKNPFIGVSELIIPIIDPKSVGKHPMLKIRIEGKLAK